MIVDCFPFFNELDLLEVRLHELSSVVDYFVLTEATLTHSNKPKPLYFTENRDKFKEFPIIPLVIDSYDGIDLSWSWNLERYQRNYGVSYAVQHFGLTEKDTLISGDADEIPSATGVRDFLTTDHRIACLNMGLYFYYFNCFCPKRPWWYSKILHPTGSPINAYRIRGHGHQPTVPRIENGGWHFTYFGDVAYKLDSFAHTERNTPTWNTPEGIAEKKRTLMHIYNYRKRFPIKVREGFSYLPQYVQDNLPRFQHLIRTPDG